MKRKMSEEGRKRCGHGKNKGRDMGGIKDLETLRNHCRIDDDGCWIYAGRINPSRKGRSPSIYIQPLHKALSIGSAVFYVVNSRTTPKGWQNVAQCGKGLCANPACRKLMRPAGHMTIKAKLGILGAEVGANLIPKPRKLTDEEVVEIYNTRHEMSAKEQMLKYGISESYVHVLRKGERRVKALTLSVNGPAGMFSQLLKAA